MQRTNPRNKRDENKRIQSKIKVNAIENNNNENVCIQTYPYKETERWGKTLRHEKPSNNNKNNENKTKKKSVETRKRRTEMKWKKNRILIIHTQIKNN